LSKKVLLSTFIIVPILGFIACIIYLLLTFYTPYQGPTTQFSIKAGEGFASINYRLHKEGFITSPRLFHHYTKYQNALNKFKAGTYEISQGEHMGQILDGLVNGTPILTRVTFAEGKNMFEFGKILEAQGITSYQDFITECRNSDKIKMLGVEAPSLEGYLFPETYKFAPNTPAKQVVEAMVRLFREKTASIDFSQSFLSPHETITLASIVEKETGAKWERPIIAGVYLNRLKRKMRLQADPTTIYGIWENFDGNLQKKHLLEVTEYNTYKMNGLPKGPIANPSLEAIKAVLNPAEHNYIFFVSKNDGTHIFTESYKDHLKAVDEWQKNPANRKGKSWRDLNKEN
jgi:UPF0755 protein